MINVSPPARSVLICAKAIGLELEQQHVDLLTGEHLKPEFLKVSLLQVLFNPNHLKICINLSTACLKIFIVAKFHSADIDISCFVIFFCTNNMNRNKLMMFIKVSNLFARNCHDLIWNPFEIFSQPNFQLYIL